MLDEESEGELFQSRTSAKLTTSPIAYPPTLLSLTQRPTDARIQAPARESPPSHYIYQRRRDITHNPRDPIRSRFRSSQRTIIRSILWRPIILSLMGLESLSIPKDRSSRSNRSWTLLSSLLFCFIRKPFRKILETRDSENANRRSGAEYEIDEYRFSHQFPIPDSTRSIRIEKGGRSIESPRRTGTSDIDKNDKWSSSRRISWWANNGFRKENGWIPCIT